MRWEKKSAGELLCLSRRLPSPPLGQLDDGSATMDGAAFRPLQCSRSRDEGAAAEAADLQLDSDAGDGDSPGNSLLVKPAAASPPMTESATPERKVPGADPYRIRPSGEGTCR